MGAGDVRGSSNGLKKMTPESKLSELGGRTSCIVSNAQSLQAAFNYLMQNQLIGYCLPSKGIWLPSSNLVVAHIRKVDDGNVAANSAALQGWAKMILGTRVITISPYADDAEKDAKKQLETAGIGTETVNLGVVFNPVPTDSPNGLGGLEKVLGAVLGNAPIVGALTSELHRAYLEETFLGGLYVVTFWPNAVLAVPEASYALKTPWSGYNPLFVATRKV